MFFSKKKKSRIVTALTLCAVTAVSVMSIGLASWQTTITGSGSVSAAGKWDVSVTDAGLQLSTGASASKEVTTYELERTGVKADRDIYGSVAWYKTGGTPATPSDQPMSKYLDYYMVDTTKYGEIVSDEAISLITADQRDAIVADETTYSVAEAIPYQYWTSTPEKIVDALLADCTNALKEKYPDTYQNYTLVRLASVTSKSFTIASMVEKKETVGVDAEDAVTYTDTEISFADVTFGLPGAWAQYSITVTNNGTVDANLSDAVIELETDSDQLVLDKPDLEKEVVKPGESCTITFVVKVPDTVTGDLDASGRLTITLPYGQISVEAAPAASHSHS